MLGYACASYTADLCDMMAPRRGAVGLVSACGALGAGILPLLLVEGAHVWVPAGQPLPVWLLGRIFCPFFLPYLLLTQK